MIAWTATFAALMWLSFIVWYTVRAKWWHNPYGRNAMAVSVVLFVILTRIALISHYPELRQYDVMGGFWYSVAGLAAVWRIVLMERAQADSGRIESHEDSEEADA